MALEEVTDPNVLATLNDKFNQQNQSVPNSMPNGFEEVKDPEMLQKLNAHFSQNNPQSQSQSISFGNLKNKSLNDIELASPEHQSVSDMIRDVIYGFGKSGANIAKTFYPNAPDMPDIKSKNSNSTMVSLGQYSPLAPIAGLSFIPSTIAAGAYGATQGEQGQQGLIDKSLGLKSNSTSNAITDAILNAVFHGAQLPLSSALPQLEKMVSPQILSENIAKELHTSITGGRNFEQAGKELATNINDAYKSEIKKHKTLYDNIFNAPTDNESIFTGEPLKVKETPMYGTEYLDKYRNYEFPDKDAKLMHDKFIDNPSIENAHKLQSELGSEIGYMSKQSKKGMLDQAGKNKLKDYNDIQTSLKNSIQEKMTDINPNLAQQYKGVTESWKKNVIPFQSDKDLKLIAEGKIKNPTTSQVISIFKNPEEDINTVTSKLSDHAQDKIVHIGMGKDIYENAPKDLLAADKSLRNKGLSSYVRPEYDQSFKNLKNNVDRESSQNKEYEENNKLIEKLLKENQMKKDKRNDAIKKTLFGTGAIGGLLSAGNIAYNRLKDVSGQ